MKNKMNLRNSLGAALLMTSLTAGTVLAADSESKIMVVSSGTAEAGQGTSAVAPTHVFVRTFAGGGARLEATTSVWLGVGVEEGTDALAAQLGLRPGEGLVVNYVSPGSPAAEAGLKANDLLVELDGQMLVDASQLRKLIRMHAEGDSLKVSYFRAGKKQTASAKLTKHANEGFSFSTDPLGGGPESFNFQAHDLPGGQKGDMSLQIQKAMASAQQAIKEAMKQSQAGQDQVRKMEVITKKLGKLADGGVDLDQNATVVVKSDSETVRTIVKTDETGSYVILADPRKHLTVHDKEGKLRFDGPIETAEQQKAVPADIWKQAAPMLDQLNTKQGSEEKP